MSRADAPKIYTKGGDAGQTSLIGGRRVSKAEFRLQVTGTVDELNCSIGLVLAHLPEPNAAQSKKEISETRSLLTDIQMRLFDIGSQIACGAAEIADTLPTPIPLDVIRMEQEIDQLTGQLTPLKNFILPGGAPSSAFAHSARAICRRTERLVVRLAERQPLPPILLQYLNRLSDYLFVLARSCNRWESVAEPLWRAERR